MFFIKEQKGFENKIKTMKRATNKNNREEKKRDLQCGAPYLCQKWKSRTNNDCMRSKCQWNKTYWFGTSTYMRLTARKKEK